MSDTAVVVVDMMNTYEHPDAEDRRARIQTLIQFPHLLASVFARHFPDADPALRHTMLEVLTCRYYKIRNLLNPKSSVADGHC